MIPSLFLESAGYRVALLSVPRFVPSFLPSQETTIFEIHVFMSSETGVLVSTGSTVTFFSSLLWRVLAYVYDGAETDIRRSNDGI